MEAKKAIEEKEKILKEKNLLEEEIRKRKEQEEIE